METIKVAGLEAAAQKSELQKKLEAQGCAFRGQERLDAHEENIKRPCYCGRPNKAE